MIHAHYVLGHQVPVRIGRAVAVIVIGSLCRYGLGLDDSSSAHRDADRTVLFKPPVQNVVIIPDDSGRAEDQTPAGTSGNLLFFEMTPGWATARDLIETGLPRSQHRNPMFAGNQGVEICCVSRTVGAFTQRFEHTAVKKLTGVDEDARGLAQSRIHVRDKQL